MMSQNTDNIKTEQEPSQSHLNDQTETVKLGKEHDATEQKSEDKSAKVISFGQTNEESEPALGTPTESGKTALNGAVETSDQKIGKKRIITYKDNLKHGEMLTIDLATGEMISSFTFEDDVLNGSATLYRKGEISSTMNYKDGLLDGPIRVFSNGIMVVENMFKAGKQNGLAKTYTKSGILLSAIAWVEGRKQGDMKSFHDCGQVSQITPYVDDRIHGTQCSFDVNGKLIRETEYLNDQKHGRSVAFYLNGTPMEISHYKNDRLVGEPVRFDPKGNQLPRL